MTAFFGLLRIVPIWAWALVAALAWGGWQRHVAASATKARAEAEQRAALEVANAQAERQAREQEAQFADNARKAADAYTQRLNQARAAAAGARGELDRLRDAIAAGPAGPASAAAAPAGRLDGHAVLRTIVGECGGVIEEMAATLDFERARLSALQDYVRSVILHEQRSSQPR